MVILLAVITIKIRHMLEEWRSCAQICRHLFDLMASCFAIGVEKVAIARLDGGQLQILSNIFSPSQRSHTTILMQPTTRSRHVRLEPASKRIRSASTLPSGLHR